MPDSSLALDIQRRHESNVCFLSETHLDEEKAKILRKKIKMDHMIVALSPDARKGGRMLTLRKEVRIYLRSSNLDFIDVNVEEQNGEVWRMTGIYGEPSWDNKDRTYCLLRDLHGQSNLTWVVIGDFNEILLSSKKDEGAPRQHACVQVF